MQGICKYFLHKDVEENEEGDVGFEVIEVKEQTAKKLKYTKVIIILDLSFCYLSLKLE